jgi:hypothetical protein
MIISTSESITPFHFVTQTLTSQRGHDLNVHPFCSQFNDSCWSFRSVRVDCNWLFVCENLCPVVGFRNTVVASLYTCFSIASISAETIFYCVGIVSCLSDAMMLLFLSLDHVSNVANERRNSKCVFYVKTTVVLPSIFVHDTYLTYIAGTLNHERVPLPL